MKNLSILVLAGMIAQATIMAQVKENVIDDSDAVSISRLSFTVFGNPYSIEKYKIFKDEKGNTSIAVFGSGFEILPFRDGRIQIPVWCDYVSDGREIGSVGATTSKTLVIYTFESSVVPETIIFWPSDNRNDKTRISVKQQPTAPVRPEPAVAVKQEPAVPVKQEPAVSVKPEPSANGQDIIVTKDARRINAKVTEINVDNVKYKNFDHQDGPLYTLPKSNILTIIYHNGQVETFEHESPTPATPAQTPAASVQTTTPETPAQASSVAQSKPRPVNILTEMKVNYPEIYASYSSGKRMKTTGWVLTGVGAGAFFGGLAMCIAGEEDGDDELIGAGVLVFLAGTASMCTGVPFLIVGGVKKKTALNRFNRQYYSAQPPAPHFQMNVYPNRIGLAYVF